MMTRSSPAHVRSARRLVAAALLPAVLAGCTGRGGGQLAPDRAFPEPASFGFTFSCEDGSALKGPTGRLRIQLSYTEHGSGLGYRPFTVHGTADKLDPVLESAICIGQNPPPGGNELIFLGRFRPTSSSAESFDASCAAPDTADGACRFEVKVRDEDQSLTPSPGDFFSITLSRATDVTSTLDPDSVAYVRAGTVTKGELAVDY